MDQTAGSWYQLRQTSTTSVTWDRIFKSKSCWTFQRQSTQLNSQRIFHRRIKESRRCELPHRLHHERHHVRQTSTVKDQRFLLAIRHHCHARRVHLIAASRRSMKRWNRRATESLNHVRASRATTPVPRHHHPLMLIVWVRVMTVKVFEEYFVYFI